MMILPGEWHARTLASIIERETTGFTACGAFKGPNPALIFVDGHYEIKDNQSMPGRGGYRPGAGRPKKTQPVETTPRTAATKAAIERGEVKIADGAPRVIETKPAGWDLILYVHKYIEDKTPEQLSALARVQNGVDVITKLAVFFDTARRYAHAIGARVPASDVEAPERQAVPKPERKPRTPRNPRQASTAQRTSTRRKRT